MRDLSIFPFMSLRSGASDGEFSPRRFNSVTARD